MAQPHVGGSDDEFVPVGDSGDNPMDDGGVEQPSLVADEETVTDELSFSNALAIDSPYSGVKESIDPEEITDPKMLSLIVKTKITDDSPQTGEVVTGWGASALCQYCLPSSAEYDESITGGEVC